MDNRTELLEKIKKMNIENNKLPKEKLTQLYKKVDNFFYNSENNGLKYREGQHNMALSVFQTIETLDHLIIEAGVGIGKSYAYLIPIIYYFELTGKTSIISTSTIALQEQLEKDINKLSVQLDIPINFVIAKGKGNFICLKRLEQYKIKIKNPNFISSEYVNDHQDRKYYSKISDKIWKQINVEPSNNCNGCKKYYSCKFCILREEMKTVKGIIICNHDLLIEDLSRVTSKPLLKEVNYIVCDEAHNIENKVLASKTKELNLNSLKNAIRNAIKFLNRLNNYDYDINKISKLIDLLSDNINKNIKKQIKKSDLCIEDCNGLKMVFDTTTIDTSKEIFTIVDRIFFSVEIHAHNIAEDLEEQLYQKKEMLKQLSNGSNSKYLFWIERKSNSNLIYFAPKNIADISYDLFFNESSFSKKTFVFTSATLSTEKNNFDYFKRNIGADKIEKGLDIEEAYESPYNYQDNSMLFYSGDIENPKKNKTTYLNDLVKKINELILLTKGKTLVLFTSKSDMLYVYDKIKSKVNNINIYLQSDGSSQDQIKNKFKNDVNSVLFSTGIFWEGIDIKGKSLSNVIIARLPFPIVDPVIEYKKNSYGERGFEKVYLPEMLMKLKQGVGRLIRSEDDRGFVTILDPRLKNNYKYLEAVKNTIPIKKFTDDIGILKEFIKNKIDIGK